MTPPPDNSWRAHFSAVYGLGLPLIGGHLAQIAIGVTDTVMLGWYGVAELAAGAIATTIYSVLMLVGSGFAWAVLPLAAAAHTVGDTQQLRRLIRMGLWLSTAFALAVMPLLLFSEDLLFRGQDATVAGNGQAYLRIAGWGMFPALLGMVLKSFLSALERTRIIMWSTVAAAIGNALTNWALIFGNWGLPELGLQGAAVSSLIAQFAVLFGLVVYCVIRQAPRVQRVFWQLWRPHWPIARQVFRLGWPIGLTTLAESSLFAASAIMIGFMGETMLAAHGIALELASVTFMVHLGLSQAGTVRAGQALSRRDWLSLRRGSLAVAVCSVSFSVLTIITFLSVPEFLVSLFLSEGDRRAPEIIETGIALLAVAALFQLADGAQVVALGLLRGLQDTRVPMLLAAFSYWVVGAPAGYLLGFTAGMGGVGVWLGLVIGLALAAAGLGLRLLVYAARLARQSARYG